MSWNWIEIELELFFNKSIQMQEQSIVDICKKQMSFRHNWRHQIVASELKDPIWHSLEWQIGSFSSEETRCRFKQILNPQNSLIIII